MSQNDQIYAFSGMPMCQLPDGVPLAALFGSIQHEIQQSVRQGCTTVQLNLTTGLDLFAAETVLRLGQPFPAVSLVCYLPDEAQANRLPPLWHRRYRAIRSCVGVVFCRTDSGNACAVLNGAARLIAVHDGTTRCETAQIVRAAEERGLWVTRIHPLDCLHHPF